jgi:hypothetical protein
MDDFPATVEMYRHYARESDFHADEPVMERSGWTAASVRAHEVANGPVRRLFSGASHTEVDVCYLRETWW